MSKIEWTDETWNPITGCSKISPGCQNCYAERMSKRLAGRFGYPKDDPFKVTLHRDKLEQPKRWKRPRKIFVCSMGDLFHEDVRFIDIHWVWDIMKACPQHIFIVLTKRPGRMKECIDKIYSLERFGAALGFWSHVWLGVTAENQEQADKRIPILLQIPAKVRFVSVEPMLGPINLTEHYYTPTRSTNLLTGIPYDWDYDQEMSDDKGERLDWVICGGESGPKARPMHPAWARSLRDQCLIAGVPYFFKQWGEWLPFDQRVVGQISNSERLKHNEWAWRTGKKSAGRLLDNKLWDEFPNEK